MSRLFATLFAVLLAQACALSAEDAGVSAGEGTTATTQDPEDDVVVTSILECELPIPCDAPFEGKSLDLTDGAAAYSASDLCAFTTLLAGERALVETATQFTDQIAYLDYAIVEPGVVLQQAWGIAQTSGQWERAAVRCELQPAAFFADCLASPTPTCLDPTQWVRGCAPLDILSCPG